MSNRDSNPYNIDAIGNFMSLRFPQSESMEILDSLMNSFDFRLSNAELEKTVHSKYPIFREFERSFPSLTFALATGIGKTRLMAAFIVYLYRNFDIKNYFIVAPNLTIYNKLIKDFSDPAYKKYVFKGIGIFNQKPPFVITGDTYKDIIAGQQSLGESITINVFNIGKINAEVRSGKEPQVKRMSEILGDSYFDYLSKLPDLVVLMDESHHYRADRGMTVINELNPLIGLELTATPQVETSKGAVKFKNVVYEYSLAKAITDGFVKEPAAATRKSFDASKFNAHEIDEIKLFDGIRIHRNTKTELEAYANNENVRLVKPFVLVVCKDTEHAREIKEYITSDDFYNGYYKDKTIELHSNQKGNEKDENVQKLLSLENEENNIEIVIHVNMLKEGWDVTNLYTIIPLRTAASLTLREQTIGRGLRLPYGTRTGNGAVDTLTIVAHDKFDEIIKAANDEASIIKQQNIIILDEDKDSGKEKEVFRPNTMFGEFIAQKEKKIKYARSEEKIKELETDIETARAVGLAIDEILTKPVNISIPMPGAESKNTEDGQNELNQTPILNVEKFKTIITANDLQKPEIVKLIKEKAKLNLEKDGQLALDLNNIDKKIELAIAPLIEQKVRHTIEIPDISLVQVNQQERIYSDFDLDTDWGFSYKTPTNEIMIENLKSAEVTTLKNEIPVVLPDTPENIIISEMLDLEEGLKYKKYKDLFYKLASQAVAYLSKDRSQKETESTLFINKKEIAKNILCQLEKHETLTPPEFKIKLLRASMPILLQDYTKFKEDEIVKYTENIPAYEIKKKVVGEYKKACHTAYKFDSVPEHVLSIVLERSKNVEKWMRPAKAQFKIHAMGSQGYEPDFVVETTENIYIVEVKAYNRIDDKDVDRKAKAARAYCENINTLYAGTEKKKWKYMMLIDREIARNGDFKQYEKENDFYALK